MSEFPLGYERVPPTTWAYLSSLLMLALYFKFTRFWSVRNLDLLLIILLAPGLLMVHLGANGRQDIMAEMRIAQREGRWEPPDPAPDSPPEAATPSVDQDSVETGQGTTSDEDLAKESAAEAESAANNALLSQWELQFRRARRFEHTGYWWLFATGGILLVRMLVDPMMVRRPLLEPNLSSAGLTFMGGAMLVFLIANIWTSEPVKTDIYAVGEVTEGQAWWEAEVSPAPSKRQPGYLPLYRAPILPTFVDSGEVPVDASTPAVTTFTEFMTKMVVMGSLLAIVVGMLMIGYLHYENYWMGVGLAAMFLMLPYTVQMMGRAPHVFPAALLVWAIVTYRLPYVSGLLMGLATGAAYYPLFLLPLWLSFYWKRGMGRFLIGVGAAIVVLVVVLAFSSSDTANFWESLQAMFGMWWPRYDGLQGIWALGWEPVFRLPLIAISVALSLGLVLWPTQKNLGALISCSCAMMIAVQFWHGYGGGLAMAWYLPLALLTIFRPNLEDRVAIRVLKENRWHRRNGQGGQAKAA